MALIKPIPILVRVWTDRMEVTRLDTGTTLKRDANPGFSNTRIVVGHYQEAEILLKEIVKALVPAPLGFSRNSVMVVQQMERSEGGLSSVEARALVDMCTHAGAKQVILYDQSEELSSQRAMEELRALW